MTVLLTGLSLLAFVALTAGTALFVAAEFSLTALERSSIEARAKAGDGRDRLVKRAHSTLSFQLSGAQLGITITTLVTGYLAEPVIARLVSQLFGYTGIAVSSAISLAVALILATSISMIFGELVPKNFALARPIWTSRATAGPIVLFSAVFAFAIRALNGIANWVLRRMGIEPAEELRSARSPQELGSLVRTSARSGALDETTATLVDRSLRFGSRTAEELMTPRTEIESLEATDTVADLVAIAVESGFSRFPITEGDLDATIGIVHVKQIFEVPRDRRVTTTLATLARPVAVVPSTLDGDAVMEQVRANGMQTALVVDEYGGTAGLVTVEDMIEEIVGDVRDEHDDATPDVVSSGGGWVVSGLLRVDEVAAATGYRAPEGEYETIGGLVLQELGHIPTVGETVELSAVVPDHPVAELPRWRARVARMDGRRIDQIELTELTDTDGQGK
ncbi:CBS domain containing-hemolysin-like protein [Mycobacteroides chelonae]|nr:CBS domain containing-hemolysin-like protein [Mycobacteroides chelonae]